MSIIRISCIREEMCAPSLSGTYKEKPYDKSSLQGIMPPISPPDLAGPDHQLRHYIDARLAIAAKALNKDAPVVLMVHGFLFDPKQIVSADPKKTDNPHSRIYHFKIAKQKAGEYDIEPAEEIREHTTGWDSAKTIPVNPGLPWLSDGTVNRDSPNLCSAVSRTTTAEHTIMRKTPHGPWQT